MPEWSVTSYEDGDEKGIFELWKAVYPRGTSSGNKWLEWWDQREYDPERWSRWWRWLYLENPAGAGRIWLAKHEGRVVSYFGLIPTWIKVGDRTILGAQAVDAMTHPDYRRRGGFQAVTTAALSQATREGIEMVYAFPNQFSGPAVAKLGWIGIGAMQLMVKPLALTKIVKFGIQNRLLAILAIIGIVPLVRVVGRPRVPSAPKDLKIGLSSSFDDRYDAFWTRVSQHYEVVVIKSSKHLDWRYAAAPNVRYTVYAAERAGEIAGYVVLRCIETDDITAGVIYELLAESVGIGHQLVWQAVEHCRDQGADFIASAAIADKAYGRSFGKAGFISIPFVKEARPYVYPMSTRISVAGLKDQRKWLLQIGDSDHL